MATAIDIQREILSAALRTSCVNSDAGGVFSSARELHQLFPDLLPNRDRNEDETTVNFYNLLDLDCNAPQTAAIESYFRATKKFLRESNVKERRQEYFALLNAGTVLRNQRLRLSHDLVMAREWLIENHLLAKNGALATESSELNGFAPQSIEEPPVLIALLEHAQLIEVKEVQALLNQMNIAPQDSLESLILSAGYVTELEMRSLRLAEILLRDKKIPPISDWPDDWPSGGGGPQGPRPPKFDPNDPSRVPRRPLPHAGSGEVRLPLPDPPEENDA